MKHLRILTIATAAVLMCSCQRDDVEQSGNSGEEAIKFNVIIEQAPYSRLDNNDLKQIETKFVVGDEIGIWIMKRPIYQTEPMLPIDENFSQVRINNKFLMYMPDGTWNFEADQKAGTPIKLLREPGFRYDYYAYYKPTGASSWKGDGTTSGTTPWWLSYSVTGGKLINNVDFMVASNTDCPDGTTVVTLKFRHLLSMFEVRQPGLGTKGSVTLFAPNMMASASGTFAKKVDDPTFLTLYDPLNTAALIVQSVPFAKVSNGRFKIFMPPQGIPTGDDTYLEICYDQSAKSDANTVIYKLKPNNATNDSLIFKSGASMYLEVIPEYNPKMVHTPNSILFTSRSGLIKRVPVAKAYAMWQTDPVLKATNPNLYGNLTLKMLWSDTPDFANIYNVALDDATKGAGAKIEMKLKSSASTLYEANAIYGLFIGDTLRWSWHLWAASNVRPDVNTFISPNNDTLMAANLGAWPSKTVKTAGGSWLPLSGAGRGLLYQWGRKDPFPGAAYDGWDFTKYQHVYNDSSKVINDALPYGVRISSQAVNVDSTTMHPMAFSTVWSPTGTMDLWNVLPDPAGIENRKSPYDPCPVGWKVGAVPTNSVYYKDGSTTLAEYTTKTWDNGVMFDKTDYHMGYYPQTNYRTMSGEFVAIGSISMWHGGAIGDSFFVEQASSYINTTADSGQKAAGMAVRCVKYYVDKEIWNTVIEPDYYVWSSFANKLKYK